MHELLFEEYEWLQNHMYRMQIIFKVRSRSSIHPRLATPKNSSICVTAIDTLRGRVVNFYTHEKTYKNCNNKQLRQLCPHERKDALLRFFVSFRLLKVIRLHHRQSSSVRQDLRLLSTLENGKVIFVHVS